MDRGDRLGMKGGELSALDLGSAGRKRKVKVESEKLKVGCTVDFELSTFHF